MEELRGGLDVRRGKDVGLRWEDPNWGGARNGLLGWTEDWVGMVGQTCQGWRGVWRCGEGVRQRWGSSRK